MPKIKNWSRKEEKEKSGDNPPPTGEIIYYWANDETGHTVYVKKFPSSYSLYYDHRDAGFRSNELRSLSTGSGNRDKIRQYAVEFMRANPSPPRWGEPNFP